MKVLKEGKQNRKMAWYCKCSTCGSELRILEGDPMATNPVRYNCDVSQYYVRYICPVCKSKEKAFTKAHYPASPEANAKYEEILLNLEDMKEIKNFERFYSEIVLNKEELDWINNRFRI